MRPATSRYLILTLVLLFVAGCSNGRTSAPPTTVAPPPEVVSTIAYEALVRENPKDTSKSDLILKDPKTGTETPYLTLENVYRDHYHPVEYHNGNVYVLHVRRDDDGTSQTELWRYDTKGVGVQIFRTHDFDFRVSDDEQFIAVNSYLFGALIHFLVNDGAILKSVEPSEIGLQDFRLLTWSQGHLWLNDGTGPMINIIANINPTTLAVERFDVSILPLQISEFDLNPRKRMIVFSDYPVIVDVDTRDEFRASGKKVTLFLYDLKTRAKRVIATSIAKNFQPKWIGEHTIELNDPEGTGRKKYAVKEE